MLVTAFIMKKSTKFRFMKNSCPFLIMKSSSLAIFMKSSSLTMIMKSMSLFPSGNPKTQPVDLEVGGEAKIELSDLNSKDDGHVEANIELGDLNSKDDGHSDVGDLNSKDVGHSDVGDLNSKDNEHCGKVLCMVWYEDGGDAGKYDERDCCDKEAHGQVIEDQKAKYFVDALEGVWENGDTTFIIVDAEPNDDQDHGNVVNDCEHVDHYKIEDAEEVWEKGDTTLVV